MKRFVQIVLCFLLRRHAPGRVRVVALGAIVRRGFRPVPTFTCSHGCGKIWKGPRGR